MPSAPLGILKFTLFVKYFTFILFLSIISFSGARTQDIPARMGGGNFTNGITDTKTLNQFKVLRAAGLKMIRMNVYPDIYYSNGQPSPAKLDKQMLLAYQQDAQPMILFEYYGSYLQSQNLPIGDYRKWFNIGKAFAERFKPNGTWAKENNIKNFGITIYTAINEPDGPKPGAPDRIPDNDYAAALEGLADGVHAVDTNLKVLPGGFLSPNRDKNYTFSGLGLALAPLLNNGKLDGLDLHTYYDVQYAPLHQTYERSAQRDFERVKQALKITRDINFYATEFNFKKRLVTEEEAAKGLLTGIWDNLGIVKTDGKTPATQFAFPWNIFHATTTGKEYGLTVEQEPWVPTARGKVIKMVAGLTAGMQFTSLDPKTEGEFILEGGGNKLYVWQNRQNWTNHPGATYTVSNIKPSHKKLEVYGWDGLRQTISLKKEKSYTLHNLPEEETLLFLLSSNP